MDLADRNTLLTLAECADALGVSTRSIRRFIADGRLKAHRIGHVVRLDPGDIITFVDEGRIVPASDGGDVAVRLSCSCSDGGNEQLANAVDKRKMGPRG